MCHFPLKYNIWKLSCDLIRAHFGDFKNIQSVGTHVRIAKSVPYYTNPPYLCGTQKRLIQ